MFFRIIFIFYNNYEFVFSLNLFNFFKRRLLCNFCLRI